MPSVPSPAPALPHSASRSCAKQSARSAPDTQPNMHASLGGPATADHHTETDAAAAVV